MTFDEDITAFYDRGDEEDRLRTWGRLEFIRTQLLGPLYHLDDADDRTRVLAEARRVLRPGGAVAAAAISRFASTVDGLQKGYLTAPGLERIVEAVLREAGFSLAALLAVEGVGRWLADRDDWLDDPARREVLLRAIARVEAEPSLLGAGPHLLAVGINP